MKHALTRAAVAALAALALAGPSICAAAESDVVREAQDRALIAELMWNYTRALDTFNDQAYAQAFTPDGAFGATKGREALRKMVLDLKTNRADREAKGEPKQGPMFHVESNEHIEFVDRDHVRNHYYWMTVFGGADKTLAPRVAAVGYGVDDLVRVEGKWLIKFRNVAPTD